MKHQADAHLGKLVPDVLARPELTPFQREVAAKVAAAVAPLPENSFDAVVHIARGRYMRIEVLPKSRRCTRVEVYVYNEPPPEVGVAAGSGVYFSVPSDIDALEHLDIPERVEKLVRAIVEGKLQETIHYEGNTAYKWVCNLDLNGESIKLYRTNVPKLVRNIWRRRTTKRVSYAGYGAR